MSHFRRLHTYVSTTEDATNQGRRHDSRRIQNVVDKYVCDLHLKTLPVIWFSNIKPNCPHKFLLHVLLSLGYYDNEVDLYHSGSLRSAYVHAGLYDPSEPQTSLNLLTKRYTTEQLCHLPGGVKEFDRLLCAAHNNFCSCLVQDSLTADGLPPVMYTHLIRTVHEKVQETIDQWKKNVILACRQHLFDAGIPNTIPTLDDILCLRCGENSDNRNGPTFSAMSITKSSAQSQKSFDEQMFALNVGARALDKYVTGSMEVPKCVTLVGDPDAGKTSVSMFLLFDALCRGLNCFCTAMLGERANELGGTHIHTLFCVPVRSGTSSGRLAEIAVMKLSKCIAKLEWLRRIDVLILDEMGQISAELLSVLDIILRCIRKNARYMGGILLFATIDILQLKPIHGRPPLLSSFMITSHVFVRLQESVRAADDVDFQKIQKLTRIFPTDYTDEDKTTFRSLIKNNCTFVDSIDDPEIPKNATFCFGKKAPGQNIQADVMDS